jgi:uncharacterized protein YdbL (DUF1318 family)
MKLIKGGLVAACLCLAIACIHVVVNVYFPEAEAKGALATLEDELLRAPAPKAPEVQPSPQKPAETPPPPTPQSLLLDWMRPARAYAAAPITEEQIITKIRSMPAVLDAYRRMASRMARVDALRASGLVGEGNDGLLKRRGDLPDRKDQRTLEDENADRSTVIRGLAEASVAAQGQAVTEEAVNQVLPDAAATFAALRREKAQAGWWIQKPDGSWIKKA